MKPTELQADLMLYLGQMGVRLEPSQIDLLARHIELVQDANQRVNLTRITDSHDAVRCHTADSLAVLQDVSAAPNGMLLDLGTGAGFPGLPLAICTTRRVQLLDSVGKKIRELRAIIEALGLSSRVEATADRAERLGRTNPGRFAVVTARAVSELPALVELAAPLLVREGRLICLKGSPEESEIERAGRVASLTGVSPEYVRVFDLPGGAGHRTILCYRKTGESSVQLPRREGMAQHAPLA